MNVKDKVALVLGAIKGIGKGIALSLAQAEAKVALTYFDWQEELAVLKEDLAAAGCSYVSMGQYLSPGRGRCRPACYLGDETFEFYKETALSFGFEHVESGRFVRSSYMTEAYTNGGKI